MNIILGGINHKTAAIEIREKFFLNSLEQDLFLSELKCNPSIVEAFVLSTCNRTEVYAHGLDTQNYDQYFLNLILKIKKLSYSRSLSKYFYSLRNEEVVRHLFRVASGLDSLVLGERQILGQVKEAFERAQTKGMFTKCFNILANLAIRTGKKAHSETGISFGGSSVSWAATLMMEILLGSLNEKTILIIGAGKMGELTTHQIFSKGVKKLYLMNRTQANAEILAKKYQGIPVAFVDMKEILSEVDGCICSADAPHYILERGTIEKIMALRHNLPLNLIDISMPRNIDPQVALIPHVFLAHIDDLEKVVEDTMRKRQSSIRLVENIIEKKLNEFYSKLKKSQEGPESTESAIEDLSSSLSH